MIRGRSHVDLACLIAFDNIEAELFRSENIRTTMASIARDAWKVESGKRRLVGSYIVDRLVCNWGRSVS